MTNWYRQIKLGYSEKKLNKLVKDIIRKDHLLVNLLNSYHVPISDIDKHLKIKIVDLKGKFAEGNGEEIKLDPKLFENNFFKDSFHYVVHEFWHWVKRRSEELFYFNDDEEVQSFSLAIAWELNQGKKEQEVFKTIYPIIEAHYNDKKNAKIMFLQMLENAKNILRNKK